MQSELIEHTVEIDEYLSATIKIPKVLDALELKALMAKANKLFNLAEVPIANTQKRKYTKSSEKWKTFSPEMVDFIIATINSGADYNQLTKNFNEKFNSNVDKDRLMKKVYYIKNRKQWDNSLKLPEQGRQIVKTENGGSVVKKTRKKRTMTKYTKSQNDLINNLIKEGKPATEIYNELTKKFGNKFKKKGIHDKIYKIKKLLEMN